MMKPFIALPNIFCHMYCSDTRISPVILSIVVSFQSQCFNISCIFLDQPASANVLRQDRMWQTGVKPQTGGGAQFGSGKQLLLLRGICSLARTQGKGLGRLQRLLQPGKVWCIESLLFLKETFQHGWSDHRSAQQHALCIFRN